MFTRGSAETFQPKKLYSGQSAKGPRTVRQSSVQTAADTPVMYPLGKAMTVRHGSADSPPLVRKIYQKQFQTGVGQIFERRTVRAYAE